MVPAVGSSAASTSLEVVVLPHPDSPTSPSVSPDSMAKLIPSTALTTPRERPKSEPPTGKCLRRSRTSRSGLSTRGETLGGQPASNHPVAVQIVRRRFLHPAPFHHPWAARMKAAAGRQIREIRGLARDAVERSLDAELGDRIEQRPGVGMSRAVE